MRLSGRRRLGRAAAEPSTDVQGPRHVASALHLARFTSGSTNCALAYEGIGDQIYALAAEIFPICRSITGNGVRETLRRLGRRIGIEVQEVPTGQQAFDWTVPREWNIREA